MGQIVDLKGQPAQLVEDHNFIVDLARFRENLLDEKAIRKKYRLANEVWEKLGDDDELIRKVEEESFRRIRDGRSKREKAQLLVVKAPEVVAKIMMDDNANARHRIDSAKVLNDFAANGPEAAAAGSLFQITIRLDADHVETYTKSRTIDPHDGEPNDNRGTPQRSLSVADKRWDDCDDDVARAPARTPIKTIEHGTGKLEDSAKQSPYDIALAALMERG